MSVLTRTRVSLVRLAAMLLLMSFLHYLLWLGSDRYRFVPARLMTRQVVAIASQIMHKNQMEDIADVAATVWLLSGLLFVAAPLSILGSWLWDRGDTRTRPADFHL